MRFRKRYLTLAGVLVPIAGLAAIHPGGVTSVRAFDPTRAPVIQERLLDGLATLEFNHGSTPPAGSASNFKPSGDSGKACPTELGDNIKVNQNCLNVSAANLQGRSQAQNETAIAINPNNSQQLVATYNDYRRGDGTCGVSYSGDNGNHWADSTLPNGFVSGTPYGGVPREYFQASGDTSVAWDTKGNAYIACQEFMRGDSAEPGGATNNPDGSSAVYVHRSTGNGGASWNFPGAPVVTSYCADYVFAAGNNCDSTIPPFIDKPYMTIDNHAGSPFQDRIYVIWTEFSADGTSYLWGNWSSDYGHTFSAKVLVSTTSSLCPYTYADHGVANPHGNCNENQFANPFTGSDGNLYVAFQNFNNAEAGTVNAGTSLDNVNQVLLVKSTDGGATFGAPIQVSRYYDLPDCVTYQNGDAGRACIPEQGSEEDSIFRGTNYPVGAVDPTNNKHIAVTYGSYLNKTSNGTTGCTPNGINPATGNNKFVGVKTAACANKILVSESTNSGASFGATGADPRTVAVVPQNSSQKHTDQWWQWSGFDAKGQLVVSYYDRQYGSDITNGNMDITLSVQAGQNGQHQGDGDQSMTFDSERVTSSSMPLPTEFPGNADANGVFFGDYSGLAVWDSAHPLWMDTRSTDLFDCGTSPPAVCTGTVGSELQPANDQDIFTDRIGL